MVLLGIMRWNQKKDCCALLPPFVIMIPKSARVFGPSLSISISPPRARRSPSPRRLVVSRLVRMPPESSSAPGEGQELTKGRQERGVYARQRNPMKFAGVSVRKSRASTVVIRDWEATVSRETSRSSQRAHTLGSGAAAAARQAIFAIKNKSIRAIPSHLRETKSSDVRSAP